MLLVWKDERRPFGGRAGETEGNLGDDQAFWQAMAVNRGGAKVHENPPVGATSLRRKGLGTVQKMGLHSGPP